jgi:hypothetical protein
MAGGRPTKFTPDTIAKLEAAFLLGCTDREACLAADVHPSNLYRYCEENPDFRERKEMLKDNPVMLARSVIVNALKDNDVQAAQKVMDRREGSKVAVTGADGGPLQIQEVRRTVVDPGHTDS